MYLHVIVVIAGLPVNLSYDIACAASYMYLPIMIEVSLIRSIN